MNNEDLIEEFLDHPNAQTLVDKVQSALNKEKKQRLEYREWLKDDVKAEFINGEIVMHSPVKRGHLEVTENLFPLMRAYVAKYGLGTVSVEKALIGLTRNDYEPDICYWTKKQKKGFNKKTMVHPAPVLAIEILSKGTKSKDRGVKFEDYAAHNITEYWIIDSEKEIVEKYFLPNKKATEYSLEKKFDVSEEIESKALSGFTIPVKAIFDEITFFKTLTEIVNG